MVAGGTRLVKKWAFASFAQARAVVNRIALAAEEEGHHPDIRWRFRTLAIELTTHAIHGLSENDFILATKIDALIAGMASRRRRRLGAVVGSVTTMSSFSNSGKRVESGVGRGREYWFVATVGTVPERGLSPLDDDA